MPTSLTYISLSTRGSSPWRPAADMGTSRRDTSTWPSPGFSRSEGTIRTPPQLRCSSRSKPYLPARGFQGTRTLMQKRKLFPDLPTASPGPFGLPRRTLLREPELMCTVPLPGSGIGTGFPFARRTCVIQSRITLGRGGRSDVRSRGGRDDTPGQNGDVSCEEAAAAGCAASRAVAPGGSLELCGR